MTAFPHVRLAPLAVFAPHLHFSRLLCTRPRPGGFRRSCCVCLVSPDVGARSGDSEGELWEPNAQPAPWHPPKGVRLLAISTKNRTSAKWISGGPEMGWIGQKGSRSPCNLPYRRLSAGAQEPLRSGALTDESLAPHQGSFKPTHELDITAYRQTTMRFQP